MIATPGRLIDFLESGKTNMQRCTYLVSWLRFVVKVKGQHALWTPGDGRGRPYAGHGV